MTIDITPAGQPEAAPAANTEQSWPEGWDRVGALETSVVGLLTVQLVIGYEWFISGLTKLWRGGFATGLSGELRDKSVGVTGGPRWFLDRVVIPHGWAFGWFVLAAELALGLTLIGVTAVFLARRHELRASTRQILLGLTALASIGGILLNISFHLANGATQPWFLPKSGFDEGVGLDSVMSLIQLAFLIVAVRLFVLGRKAHRSSAR